MYFLGKLAKLFKKFFIVLMTICKISVRQKFNYLYISTQIDGEWGVSLTMDLIYYWQNISVECLYIFCV